MDNIIFVGIIVFVVVMYIIIDIIRICKCQRYEAIDNQINTIEKYASSLVAWADYFMKDNTGNERMQETLRILEEFCQTNNINISELGLMAIIQNCYNKLQMDKALMKKTIVYKEQITNIDKDISIL